MILLIMMAAFSAYLAVSVCVVWGTVRWARMTGRNPKRWGVAAALCMYLLVFWDHVPTILLHKYYCATKAGFWVYKTPEQWKAENPGVAETLTWRRISANYSGPDKSWGLRLNERFVLVHKNLKSFLFPVYVDYESILDLKNNESIVKRISVWSGYRSLVLGGEDWRLLKFWVGAKPCYPNADEFSELSKSFKQLGRELQ